MRYLGSDGSFVEICDSATGGTVCSVIRNIAIAKRFEVYRDERNLKTTEVIILHCPNLNINKCRANSVRKAEQEVVILVQALRCPTPYFQISHTHAHNIHTDVKVPNITLPNITYIYTGSFLSFKRPTGSEFHLS
jgi:hypothetical protein